MPGKQVDFSAEQIEFRGMVDRFLGDRSPLHAARRLIEAGQGYDPAVWTALATELGATGIHVSEALGGAGFGVVELGIVLEEMGRHLYCGPFFSSAVLATTALQISQSPVAEALLASVADGTRIGALLTGSLDDPDRLGSGLRISDEGSLRGVAPLVPGASEANLFLALVQESTGLGLYRLDTAPILRPRKALDATRSLAEAVCDGIVVQRLGTIDVVSVKRLWSIWSVALAHELVGAAEALLYNTVDYLGVRVQFGRTIGSFQALKHRCADLLLEVELAKALTHEGARVLDAGEDPTEIAHMAKALASEASMSAARAAIQLRGGIGFTWENDSHLWFRRIKASEVLFGSPARHREWLMQYLENTTHAA